jgi:hypothetical protein
MKAKTWRDISLKKAIELTELGDDDEIKLIISQLAIILDIDDMHIENTWAIQDILDEYKKWDFVRQLPEAKQTKTVKHAGRRYGICELNKLTMAQMVDIEEIYSQGMVKNLHKIISILYLPIRRYNPITSSYSLEDYEYSDARAEAFLELDMEFVWGNALFFYRGVEAYTRSLADFLIQLKMETAKKMNTKQDHLA